MQSPYCQMMFRIKGDCEPSPRPSEWTPNDNAEYLVSTATVTKEFKDQQPQEQQNDQTNILLIPPHSYRKRRRQRKLSSALVNRAENSSPCLPENYVFTLAPSLEGIENTEEFKKDVENKIDNISETQLPSDNDQTEVLLVASFESEEPVESLATSKAVSQNSTDRNGTPCAATGTEKAVSYRMGEWFSSFKSQISVCKDSDDQQNLDKDEIELLNTSRISSHKENKEHIKKMVTSSSVESNKKVQQQKHKNQPPFAQATSFPKFHHCDSPRSLTNENQINSIPESSLLNRNDIIDELWQKLKITTNSIFSNLGKWVNDFAITADSNTTAANLNENPHLFRSMPPLAAAAVRKFESIENLPPAAAKTSHLPIVAAASNRAKTVDLVNPQHKLHNHRKNFQSQQLQVSKRPFAFKQNGLNRSKYGSISATAPQQIAENQKKRSLRTNATISNCNSFSSLILNHSKSSAVDLTRSNKQNVENSKLPNFASSSASSKPPYGIKTFLSNPNGHIGSLIDRDSRHAVSRQASSGDNRQSYGQKSKLSKCHSHILPSPRPLASTQSCTRPSASSAPSIHQVQPKRNAAVGKEQTAPRLPPPPSSPRELVRPSRQALFAKSFRTRFWKELPIKRQSLTLPPATLWQNLWHSVDSETKKIRLLRRRTELFGKYGPFSRQTFYEHDNCDSSPLTWRESWKSHLELTIFSIENTPFIGQVVIDTDGFRIDLPFRVNFVRIPIQHYNQIVRVWFNSAYQRPYRRRRSKFLFTRVINNPDDLSEESENDDDDDEDVRDGLEDSFISNEEIMQATLEKLPVCVNIDAEDNLYTPQGEWDTYFRIDIPTSAVIKAGSIEDVAIVTPQQIFYHNNQASLDPETIFELLRREAKTRYKDPKIKFAIKVQYQGLKNLVCTGDTFPSHPCSLPSSSSSSSIVAADCPNDGHHQLNSFKQGTHQKIDSTSNLATPDVKQQPVNPCVFDVRQFIYRPTRQTSKFSFHERRVYVGCFDDPIDLQISIELNRLNGALLSASEGQQPIERVSQGVYSIYGEEYHVDRILVALPSLSSLLDLSELRLEPNDPLFATLMVCGDQTFPLNLFYDQQQHNPSSSSSSSGASFCLAVIYSQDFQQPFHNFIRKTRTNFILATTNTSLFQISGRSSSDFEESVAAAAANGFDIIFPNLMLSNEKLPFGARNDVREMFKLTKHAEAILANLKFSRFGPGSINAEQYKLINSNLTPPLIRMAENDTKQVPVTFYWDIDEFEGCCNERVEPVDLSEGPRLELDYLIPFNYLGGPAIAESIESSPSSFSSEYGNTYLANFPNQGLCRTNISNLLRNHLSETLNNHPNCSLHLGNGEFRNNDDGNDDNDDDDDDDDDDQQQLHPYVH